MLLTWDNLIIKYLVIDNINGFLNNLKRKKMDSDKKNSEDVDMENFNEDEVECLDESEMADNDCADDQSVDVNKLLEENEKLKNDFLRAYADAENIKKRCQQELDKSVKFAVADFAKNLLPVADNLQRALDAVEKDKDDESKEALRKGVELTQNELMKVFDKFGIHKMEIMGKVFDPNFHQVVQEVADKSKEVGTIVAEIQTGYMIHDRILREAMVVVTKQ